MPNNKNQLSPPHLRKEPAKLRQPVDGRILLHERGRHCLYFTELPLMTHALCCGARLWSPCPDFDHCRTLPPRGPRDTTWLEAQIRRRT